MARTPFGSVRSHVGGAEMQTGFVGMEPEPGTAGFRIGRDGAATSTTTTGSLPASDAALDAGSESLAMLVPRDAEDRRQHPRPHDASMRLPSRRADYRS